MENIKAVGFDLFNTLITMELLALKDALTRLTGSLKENGFAIDHGQFVKAHSEAVLDFLEQTKRDGRESHNRFWVSTALAKLGHDVSPDDPHISTAVDVYFSAFIQHATIIPGTKGNACHSPRPLPYRATLQFHSSPRCQESDNPTRAGTFL